MMQNGEWLDQLAGWLEEFDWQWFATLTSRPGLSQAQLRWRLRRWAEELDDALGTESFEWIGVPEKGVTGMHFHFHVLIAGLDANSGAIQRLAWMRRWSKLAGDAQIEDFRANSGGVRYVLKHVGPQDVDEIEFHLVSRIRVHSAVEEMQLKGRGKMKSEIPAKAKNREDGLMSKTGISQGKKRKANSSGTLRKPVLSKKVKSMRVETLEGYWGLCPICKKTDGYINIGREHWFLCDKHRTCWHIGSNLFSSWRAETEAEQRHHCEEIGFNTFRIVKPFYPEIRGVYRSKDDESNES